MFLATLTRYDTAACEVVKAEAAHYMPSVRCYMLPIYLPAPVLGVPLVRRVHLAAPHVLVHNVDWKHIAASGARHALGQAFQSVSLGVDLGRVPAGDCQFVASVNRKLTS